MTTAASPHAAHGHSPVPHGAGGATYPNLAALPGGKTGLDAFGRTQASPVAHSGMSRFRRQTHLAWTKDAQDHRMPVSGITCLFDFPSASVLGLFAVTA